MYIALSIWLLDFFLEICEFAGYAMDFKIFGGIPYTDHGVQITPPPLFLIFVYFLFLCLF